MPLIRFPTVKGLVYTIDLSKIADRENPRTVEAPIHSQVQEPTVIDWGDGTSEVVSSGTYPEHTYAEGAGDVFTVTLRSATGHLPMIKFNADNSPDTLSKGITHAVISVDHFGGFSGSSNNNTFTYAFLETINLEYFDPRLAGQYNWTNFQGIFRKCGSTQPFLSLCFDFLTGLTLAYIAFNGCKMTGALPDRMFSNSPLLYTITEGFRACKALTSVPQNIFATNGALASVSSAFRGCDNADFTEPFVFWKEDGSIDTDKFPSLTNTDYCYSGCNETLRAKVPTAYGGTMTVS